jgi:histone acetyltransferase (RNA polymerase elongator complex component)
MKRHYIIPIFVPHQGCPHDCVFCNQRTITGHRQGTDLQEVRVTIEKYLATFPQGEGFHKEIAFYGGSFTGISQEDQKKLLELALDYKWKGQISGIRISTRPDYVTIDVLHFLRAHGVTVIELGVQSFDDEVLCRSRRGHSSHDVLLAVKAIRQFDITMGLQMMIGLPGDTLKKTAATARSIANLHPDFVRIYPTVVIEGTYLASLYRQGMYIPLSLEEAVDWAASAQLIFEKSGIPVIRIGLQPTKDLCSDHGIIAGPFHPAFRELVESRIAYNMMANLIHNLPINPHRVIFRVHPRYLSPALGNKKFNLMKLSADLGIDNINIYADQAIDRGEIILHMADGEIVDRRISKRKFPASSL